MTTLTWHIQQLDCYPEYETQSDVVFKAHWTLEADDGLGHTGFVYGSTPVSLTISDGFTAFADLTEAEVLGWVHGAMGATAVAAFEANATQQVTDQVNPPVISPPLPWV
jgi:hypothetical protein